MIPLLLSTALAGLDPQCDTLVKPADYDDQLQSDFLMNYFALTTTMSPVHAAIPHAPGRGALGVDLGVIPPLNCWQRAAYGYSKNEDTNASPLLPRLRASFAFPAGKWAVPYVGLAYMGPIPVGGLYNVTFGAELGVGFLPDGPVQPGVRVHAASIRTIGEIAGPVSEEDPTVDDLYAGSTVGVDLLVSSLRHVGQQELSPFLALGFTDVSTAFVVGDDGILVGNQHPYFGPVMSLGLDALLAHHLRLGGELYAAPGGFSRPAGLGPETSDRGFGAYGHLYTVRARIGWEFGGPSRKVVAPPPPPVEPPPVVVTPPATSAVSVFARYDGRLLADTPVLLRDASGQTITVPVGNTPAKIELPPGSTWMATADRDCLHGVASLTVTGAGELVVDLAPRRDVPVELRLQEPGGAEIEGASAHWSSADCIGCVPEEKVLIEHGYLRQMVCEGTHELFVERAGYRVVHTTIVAEPGSLQKVDVEMKAAQVEMTTEQLVILDRVYFATNDDEIEGRSFELLDEISATILAHPEIGVVEIAGHTDNVGSAYYNESLSQRRADAVRAWLVQRGVPADRLIAKGYGTSRPLVPNDTEAGRDKNRRVEFEIKGAM